MFPVTQINLPSEGKYYPEGSYLRSVSGKIGIYPLLTRHEDMIASSPKSRATVVSVVKELIADSEVRDMVDQLAYCDFVAILLSSRIIAYGPEMKYNITCPVCERNAQASINIISDLSNKDFKNANFYIEAVSGDILVFNNPTVKDIFYTTDPLPPTKLMHTLLCEGIINGIKTTKSDIPLHYIEQLTIKDTKAFREAYKNATFGVDTTYTMTCPQCGEKTTYAISIPEEIFCTTYSDLHAEIFALCTKSEGGFKFFDVYEMPAKYRRDYLNRLIKEQQEEKAKQHKDSS